MVSSELARNSLSWATISGRIVSFVGSKNTATLAMRKLSTYTDGSDQVTATGTRAMRPARSTSAVTITVRLLKRSMMTPAKAPKSTYGKVYRARITPVPSVEPVRA